MRVSLGGDTELWPGEVAGKQKRLKHVETEEITGNLSGNFLLTSEVLKEFLKSAQLHDAPEKEN